MKIIQDGEYHGTGIYILHRINYEPTISDYIYTYADYGSCSACDTLQEILGYNYDEKPNEQQVQDLMRLALHLLQRCKYMEED